MKYYKSLISYAYDLGNGKCIFVKNYDNPSISVDNSNLLIAINFEESTQEEFEREYAKTEALLKVLATVNVNTNLGDIYEQN